MKTSMVSVGLLGLALAMGADAAELGCIGGYNFRQGGTELDTTHYRFRNFNRDRTLTITNISVYAFNGAPLLVFSASNFPADFNPVLSPHQTTGIELEDFLGNAAAPNHYVQTVVTWEADRAGTTVVPLDGAAGRITYARNSVTGERGQTRARSIVPCRELGR